jgi:hypothetical protein
MDKIIWTIIKAIFLLYCATHGLLILTGHFRAHYNQEKVKKYKWLYILFIIVLYIGGIAMLLGSIIKILGIKL